MYTLITGPLDFSQDFKRHHAGSRETVPYQSNRKHLIREGNVIWKYRWPYSPTLWTFRNFSYLFHLQPKPIWTTAAQ
jgi:hypothetical protein